MPSYTAGRVATCLLTKLHAIESGGDHRYFEILDDAGNRVARTKLSHSFRATTQLSDNLLRDIRNQLRLSRASELRDLIECPLSREAYLDLVSG